MIAKISPLGESAPRKSWRSLIDPGGERRNNERTIRCIVCCDYSGWWLFVFHSGGIGIGPVWQRRNNFARRASDGWNIARNVIHRISPRLWVISTANSSPYERHRPLETRLTRIFLRRGRDRHYNVTDVVGIIIDAPSRQFTRARLEFYRSERNRHDLHRDFCLRNFDNVYSMEMEDPLRFTLCVIRVIRVKQCLINLPFVGEYTVPWLENRANHIVLTSINGCRNCP